MVSGSLEKATAGLQNKTIARINKQNLNCARRKEYLFSINQNLGGFGIFIPLFKDAFRIPEPKPGVACIVKIGKKKPIE